MEMEEEEKQHRNWIWILIGIKGERERAASAVAAADFELYWILRRKRGILIWIGLPHICCVSGDKSGSGSGMEMDVNVKEYEWICSIYAAYVSGYGF